MNLQNKVVSHIDLYTDLSTGGRPAFIYAKQYDAKSRYIIATIKNGYRKIEINGAARFNAKKPDGTFFYTDCQINDDSTVTVELDSQILSVDGEVSCDISIFDGDIPNRLILTTSTFFVIVEKSNYDLDAIKSSNIYVDLDDAKDKAQKAAEQAEASSSIASDAAKAAEKAADRAELAGGGISEEVDRRLKAIEDQLAYEPIKFESFSMAPSNAETAEYEHGSEVQSVKVKWKLNKAAAAIDVNDTLIGSTDTEYVATGPFTSDREWEVFVREGEPKYAIASRTAKISFYYRVYWGVGTQASGFDGDFVTKLQNTDKAYSKSLIFSVEPNTQYIYYAVPKDLCDTEPIFNIDDGFSGGFMPKVEVTVTRTFGDRTVEIAYYIYRSIELIKDPDGELTRVTVS